jgi:hypothetical protein
MNTNFTLGKPERKREIGRPSCKWNDNNKLDVKELE